MEITLFSFLRRKKSMKEFFHFFVILLALVACVSPNLLCMLELKRSPSLHSHSAPQAHISSVTNEVLACLSNDLQTQWYWVHSHFLSHIEDFFSQIELIKKENAQAFVPKDFRARLTLPDDIKNQALQVLQEKYPSLTHIYNTLLNHPLWGPQNVGEHLQAELTNLLFETTLLPIVPLEWWEVRKEDIDPQWLRVLFSPFKTFNPKQFSAFFLMALDQQGIASEKIQACLSKISHARSIYFPQDYVFKVPHSELKHTLSHFPNLKELVLVHYDAPQIETASWEILFGYLPSLESLNLSHVDLYRLSDENLSILTAHSHSLRSLDLSYTFLWGADEAIIDKLFDHLPHLQTLKFDFIPLKYFSKETLVKIFSRLKNLSSLSLNWSSLHERDDETVQAIFSHLTNLRAFEGEISAEYSAEKIKIIASSMPHLEYLSLGNSHANRSDDQLQALHGFRSITYLHLSTIVPNTWNKDFPNQFPNLNTLDLSELILFKTWTQSLKIPDILADFQTPLKTVYLPEKYKKDNHFLQEILKKNPLLATSHFSYQ